MSEEQLPAESGGKMVVFAAKQIRRIWHEEQWFFSVVDIIAALTDSPNPHDYWYRMKRREKESSGIELSTLCRQLEGYRPDTLDRPGNKVGLPSGPDRAPSG